ncbi:dihydrodipicolinate synthase family protein [Devosia sp. A449]
MDRSSVDWHGYWSAVVTCFTSSGAIDETAFAGIIDWTVRTGAHGMLINGSTGEYGTQTLTERMQVAEIAIAANQRRVPLIVNISAARPTDAIALAKHAAASGADGVLLAPPALVRPTTAELMHYYARVLGATALPACVYNFPQEAGHALSLEEIAMLTDIDTVVAIKQASSDLRDTLAAIELLGHRIRIFGHLLSPLGVTLLNAGQGDGYMGSGMLFGAAQPGFFNLVAEGRLEEARQTAHHIETGLKALLGPRRDGYNWANGGMQPTIKAAMALLGVPAGYPREPKLPLDPAQTAALAETLRAIGLLAATTTASAH